MPRLNTYDPPLISALVKFHQWTKARRINYAVLGGIAAGAWGKPRSTLDLDVLILLESVEINEFSVLAQQAGFLIKSAEFDRMIKSDMFRLRYPVTAERIIRIDCILATYPYYNKVLRRKRYLRVKDQRIPFVSPEDLIILKLLSNRPLDRIDVANVFSLSRRLDMNYLRKWAKRFGLLKTLRRFL